MQSHPGDKVTGKNQREVKAIQMSIIGCRDEPTLSIHRVEYYSLVKRNEVLTHSTAWANLENIMLGEKARHERPFI